MKKLLTVLAISALVLSSCGTKKAENKEGTHVHEDGAVHESHEHEAPVQEAYEVEEEHAVKDSSNRTEHEEDHKHDHDHSHE